MTVDGGSKWRSCMRMVWRWPWATEEWRWRLNVNARENGKCTKPWCICNSECVSRGHFWLTLFSFGPPSRALVVITWRGEGYRYMMRLGKTDKMAPLQKLKAQVSSILAKGWILDACACVIWLDMNTPFIMPMNTMRAKQFKSSTMIAKQFKSSTMRANYFKSSTMRAKQFKSSTMIAKQFKSSTMRAN